MIEHDNPRSVDVLLYDAMFIIQSLPTDLPLRLGDIAKLLLKNIYAVRQQKKYTLFVTVM